MQKSLLSRFDYISKKELTYSKNAPANLKRNLNLDYKERIMLWILNGKLKSTYLFNFVNCIRKRVLGYKLRKSLSAEVIEFIISR